MAKTILVERDEELGARFVCLLDAAGIDVRSALWLYREESTRWRFVIESPIYDSLGPSDAYDAVLNVLRGPIHEAGLAPDDIQVTGQRNDVIRALHTRYNTGPRDIDSIRLAGDIIDRVLIDEAYVYRVA